MNKKIKEGQTPYTQDLKTLFIVWNPFHHRLKFFFMHLVLNKITHDEGEKTITSVACSDKFNNKSNSNVVGEKNRILNYNNNIILCSCICSELFTTHEDWITARITIVYGIHTTHNIITCNLACNNILLYNILIYN